MTRPTLTRGKIHFFARRLLAGEPIPLFVLRANNVAIEACVTRILRRRTRRRRADHAAAHDLRQIKCP